MTTKILIVEDDLTLQKVLRDFLKDEGFVTETASTGAEALVKIEQLFPDLVLLDLGLPDINGESILTKVRVDHPELPVVILTAKSKPHEIAAGLSLGADDYLAKPFAAEELLARVHARIRKRSSEVTSLRVKDLVLDLSKMVATRNNREIDLTKTEFKLLELLMENAGRVLSRDLILNKIWGYSPDVESRVVDIYIGYLRQKIDSRYTEKYIKNKRGFGYLIESDK